MKKVVTMIFLLMFALSFAVADNNNSEDSHEVGLEQEQHLGDSIQNQEQNKNMLGEPNQYQRGNLTQEQIQKIIQTKNQLKINTQNQECPLNCSCDGSTTKCKLQNGTREMVIKAGNSGNTIVQVKNVNMSTQVQLYKSEDGKIYGVFKNNETKEIILPDEVQERLQNQTRLRLQNMSMELTENGTYQVQAKKRARLFWMFSVQERVNAEIDAETGEIIRTRNSWWGFLARDVRSAEQ